METIIGELQQELYVTLKKAERNRKRIRYARIYQKKYSQAEVSSITCIIRTMFPEASLNLIHDDLHLSLVTSALFAKRMENISGNFRGIFADAIMLSFNGNRFFFAVAMPEGFLTLGSAPLSTGEALSDLYDNITTAREILNILKLN